MYFGLLQEVFVPLLLNILVLWSMKSVLKNSTYETINQPHDGGPLLLHSPFTQNIYVSPDSPKV